MMQSVLDPAGPQASAIATLTWWFFGVCAVVYVLTMAALLWAILRPRQNSDDSPQTSRRLALVIAGATGITVLTLVVLNVVSVAAGRGLTSPSGAGAITVDAIGHQWWWEFQYHDVSANQWVTSPNELHIPVGVPVVIKAQSRDVIHSFWAPNLHGKRDLIPGMVTHTWIQADKPGIYRGQCAEFCGPQHAKMAFFVVAEEMDAFTAWLQQQRRGAPPPASDSQKRGHDLFMRGTCVMCHTVRATSAGARVGPDLTHVASRRTIGAGTLATTRDNLARWIRDPHTIKPGIRMPPHRFEQADLQALIDYLEMLR